MISKNGKTDGNGELSRIQDIRLRFVGDAESVTGWFVPGGIYLGHVAKLGKGERRPWSVYLSEEVEDDPGYYAFPADWFEIVKDDVI